MTSARPDSVDEQVLPRRPSDRSRSPSGSRATSKGRTAASTERRRSPRRRTDGLQQPGQPPANSLNLRQLRHGGARATECSNARVARHRIETRTPVPSCRPVARTDTAWCQAPAVATRTHVLVPGTGRGSKRLVPSGSLAQVVARSGLVPSGSPSSTGRCGGGSEPSSGGQDVGCGSRGRPQRLEAWTSARRVPASTRSPRLAWRTTPTCVVDGILLRSAACTEVEERGVADSDRAQAADVAGGRGGYCADDRAPPWK